MLRRNSHYRGMLVLGLVWPDTAMGQVFDELGFPNVNVDLIYAWPGQSRSDWLRSVKIVAGLCPNTITIYPLIMRARRRLQRPWPARATFVRPLQPFMNITSERDCF